MKVFLAILAVVSCVVAEQISPKGVDQFGKSMEVCLKQHPLSDKQLEILGQSFSDETVRKYVVCMAKEIAFHSISNKYSMVLKDDEIRNLANECVDTNLKFDQTNTNEKVVLLVHGCLMNGVKHLENAQ